MRLAKRASGPILDLARMGPRFFVQGLLSRNRAAPVKRIDVRGVRGIGLTPLKWSRSSLLHFAGQAPWSYEALMRQVRDWTLPRMIECGGPITAWIIDDTGFPKKGKHSVGVARQYCGQLGKQDNCQVAVSLSIANEGASLPVAWRLYLPEIWLDDAERRQKAKIPAGIAFQTKLQIAIDQIRAAIVAQTPVGVVIADAGYGTDGGFRAALSALGLVYSVGVQPTLSVWRPGEGPLPGNLAKRAARGGYPALFSRVGPPIDALTSATWLRPSGLTPL